MTQELDTATPIAALNAITGPNAPAASAMATNLATLAAPYHAAYGATGVDAAKLTWALNAAIEYNSAAHLCRYAESLGGGTPAALGTVDLYDASAILARLNAAIARVKQFGDAATAAAVTQLLQGYSSSVTTMWADAQGSAPVGGALPDAYLSLFFWPAFPPGVGGKIEVAKPSVRSLELPVAVAIDQANAALTAFAFS